ncbi:MAG: adenosylcobinamide-GDP ribazoletransferase [Nocardioidaceae bacterium]|nr:adenosylcobinamide-GDP ribazoletransferase [Nocardioidaceae bacterium]NUS51307.1 adenosylcobinamide-GDP ribazoletransferase [Nocardioidaceae bacterium]
MRLCLGTLTVLPVRPPEAVDRRTAGGAMVLAPLAGLLLGLAAALVALLPLPPLVIGLLAVGVLAVGSRALHLDGLADTADGLGSRRPAAGALEVMRRSDIGPFGVVALVFAIGLQAASAASTLDRPGGAAALVVAVMAARTVLPLLCHRLPAARPEGLGQMVAGTVGTTSALLSLGLAAVLCAGVLLADPAYGVVRCALAAVVGVLAGLGFAAHCVRRFGGLTGDVLGAGVETALTAALLVLAPD